MQLKSFLHVADIFQISPHLLAEAVEDELM